MRNAPADFTTRIFAEIGIDRYITTQSALGDVFVASRASGVTALRPATDAIAFESWYGERFGRRVVPAIEDDPIARLARQRLMGADVDVALDLSSCSPFERRVLDKAAEIGHGHARPYGWVARELGEPGAMRAVGNALGKNPVPLLIPCHRVIRSDNSIGGYVFGGNAKRTLLEDEGLDFSAIEKLTKRGFHYVSCGDGTFCLPTCGDISSHLSEPGYTALRDLDDAHARGLVPCTSCRPIAA